MTIAAIQSAQFNVYLRMDGRDVTKAEAGGSGIVKIGRASCRERV